MEELSVIWEPDIPYRFVMEELSVIWESVIAYLFLNTKNQKSISYAVSSSIMNL
jgi:hypothetical protein